MTSTASIPFSVDLPMPVSEKQHGELKTRLLRIEVALGIVGVPLLGWLAFLSVTLFGMKGDLQAVKQKLKDGGLGDIVSKIEKPTSPVELQAALSTVVAQIQTAKAEGKPPNPQKTQALSAVLSKTVQRNPQLPQVWQAISAVASYRTSQILSGSALLADCDIDQQPRIIDPSEVPEINPDDSYSGYIFRNCTLHLDRLPPGRLARGTLTQDLPAHAPFHAHAKGTAIVSGEVAYIIHCDIMLNRFRYRREWHPVV